MRVSPRSSALRDDLLASTRSDGDGRFHFGGVPPGQGVWLSVEAAGYAVFILQPELAGSQELSGLILQLEQQRMIRGRLVDPAGRPLAGVQLTIEGTRRFGDARQRLDRAPTWEALLGHGEARTTTDGSFQFDALYPGRFELGAHWFDQTERSQFFEVIAGGDPLELVVDPGLLQDVSFSGRVVDALTGAPVERFSVIVLGLGEGGWEFNSPPHEFEDPRGRFAIGGLAPMDLSLFVAAQGYRDRGELPQPRSPGMHVEEIRLDPVRSLSLRVRGLHDEALRGMLMVQDSQGNPIWVPVTRGGTAAGLALDEEGRGVLQNLPATQITVRFYPAEARPGPEGSQRSWQFSFDLREPRTKTQELTVDLPK